MIKEMYQQLIACTYTQAKLKEIRQELESLVYPLPPIVIGNSNIPNKQSCYATALGLTVSDPLKQIYFPGKISGYKENAIWSLDDLTTRTEADLAILGLGAEVIEASIKDIKSRSSKFFLQNQLIFLYYGATPHDWPIRYHFVRSSSSNATFVEKPNWKDPAVNIPRQIFFSQYQRDLKNGGLQLRKIYRIDNR